MAGEAHHYPVTCSWSGTTAVGYQHYDRSHTVVATPASTSLHLSGDPAFLGDASKLNPEQLLVAAAASCQLLSFLALAARARIDVVEYHDEATGTMPLGTASPWITEIHLNPVIRVANGPTIERIERLVGLAHRECYIANSLKSEITINPTIHFG